MAEKSTEDEGERAGVRGPLADLTAFRLIKLGDLIYAEAQRTLAPLGLTPRLFHVLAGAASMDAPSQQDLARTLGFDPNVMVGVVDELERLGLAERARNPRDRRRYIVAPTEAGTARLAEAAQAVREAEDRLMSAIPAKDRAALHRASALLLAAHPGTVKTE
ncbi:MarR family winged helix-turn-helix transcriptional regulator [Nocardiopsis composta]|uniref:DNA-binding MarR family transcriptional regulator n=1 Tax=Nocardiopsis composta TaxID=157465 RepID=A0A7W8VF37_9ACTN|nr:MarR family transcriptional regulator [Nocardiopsis composta]MBB5433992.1 DNA-binding MarR family transcriptional regulator [Nocardiopsis composta]